jgi:hypothetical protein
MSLLKPVGTDRRGQESEEVDGRLIIEYIAGD